MRTGQAAVLPWQVAVGAVGVGMLPPLVLKAQEVFLGADALLTYLVQIHFGADARVFCQADS